MNVCISQISYVEAQMWWYMEVGPLGDNWVMKVGPLKIGLVLLQEEKDN